VLVFYNYILYFMIVHFECLGCAQVPKKTFFVFVPFAFSVDQQNIMRLSRISDFC
jgi:hypothetical protein